MALFVKDPDSRIDHAMDWATLNLGINRIAASDWIVAPQEEGGLSVMASGHDGLATYATVEGGRPGRCYDLVNRVTLGNGEVVERSTTFRVEQR